MEQLAGRVRELILAVDDYRKAVATAVGVSIVDTAALVELLHTGPLVPTALGRRLGLASASVTAVLDRLELTGLVAREPNPADRRSLFIVLTPTGRAAATGIFGVFRDDVLSAVRQAHPDHIREFDQALGRMAVALRARAQDPAQLATAIRTRTDPNGSDQSTST